MHTFRSLFLLMIFLCSTPTVLLAQGEAKIPTTLQPFCEAAENGSILRAVKEEDKLITETLQATQSAMRGLSLLDFPKQTSADISVLVHLHYLQITLSSLPKTTKELSQAESEFLAFSSMGHRGKAKWLSWQGHQQTTSRSTLAYIWRTMRTSPQSPEIVALYLPTLPESDRMYFLVVELLRTRAEGREHSHLYKTLLQLFHNANSMIPDAITELLRHELNELPPKMQANLLASLCHQSTTRSLELCLPFLAAKEPVLTDMAVRMLQQYANEEQYDIVLTAMRETPIADRAGFYMVLFKLHRTRAVDLMQKNLERDGLEIGAQVLPLLLDHGSMEAMTLCGQHYQLLSAKDRSQLNQLIVSHGALNVFNVILQSLPDRPSSDVTHSVMQLCLDMVKQYRLYTPSFLRVNKFNASFRSTLPESEAMAMFDQSMDTVFESQEKGQVTIEFEQPCELAGLEIILDSRSNISLSHSLKGVTTLDHDDLNLGIENARNNHRRIYRRQFNESADANFIQFVGLTGQADQLTVSFHAGTPIHIREIIIHILPSELTVITMLRQWATREFPKPSDLQKWFTASNELYELDYSNITSDSSADTKYRNNLDVLSSLCPNTLYIPYWQMLYNHFGQKLPLPTHHEAEQIITIDPLDFEPWYIRGLTEKDSRKDLASASKYFREAILRHNDDVELMKIQADALYQTKQNEESLICHRVLMRMQPRERRHSNRVGILLMRLERNWDAEAIFRRQIALFGDVQVPRYNLACSLAKQNHAEAAIESLRISNQIDPKKFNSSKINKDSDFDRIRNSELFQTFLRELESSE